MVALWIIILLLRLALVYYDIQATALAGSCWEILITSQSFGNLKLYYVDRGSAHYKVDCWLLESVCRKFWDDHNGKSAKEAKSLLIIVACHRKK